MELSKISLKGRIIILVCTLLLSQSVLIGVAYQKSSALLGELEQVTTQELPSTKNLILADMMHDSLRAIVLGALFADSTNDRAALLDYEKEAKENSEKFLNYFKNVGKLKISELSRKKLNELNGHIKEYADLCQTVISDLLSGDKLKAKNDFSKFKEKFEFLETQLGLFGDAVEADSKFTGEHGKNIVSFILVASALGILVSLIMGFIIFLWTRNSFDSILKQIKSIAQLILNSTRAVTRESSKVKDSTVEQSAAIQESVSALSEMSSMIGQTGQNVKVSIETVVSTHERSNEGKKIMEHLSESMASIQKANVSLQDISKVIDNIVTKTAVINDIVFKTQLLSFNASIEAARAGIHGRGFAVVAEEVGNLAELSGAAAKEIEALLGESQRRVRDTLEIIYDRVSDGNRVSQNAFQVFVDISKNIAEIDIQVKGIGEATQQQEIGIQQTNTAMKQMDLSSQSNTEAASVAQSTAVQLKSDCDQLNQVVDDIFSLINGNKTTNRSNHFIDNSLSHKENSESMELKNYNDADQNNTDESLHDIVGKSADYY